MAEQDTAEEVTEEPGEIVDEAIVDEVAQDDGSESETSTEAQEASGETAEAEITVSIGDAEPAKEEPAPQWVKDLRKRNRELERELREAKTAKQPEHQAIGPKPSLGDPDIDYDSEKFAAKLEAWMGRKRAADQATAEAEAEAANQQAQWQAKLGTYTAAKAALKIPDFDDTEAIVKDALSVAQQTVIVKYAKNPAYVVLALGKNPGKLAELKKHTDLIEFNNAVRDLEAQLKVTKKTPTAPERKVTGGSAPNTGSASVALDKRRETAMNSGGDLTEVLKLRRDARRKEMRN